MSLVTLFLLLFRYHMLALRDTGGKPNNFAKLKSFLEYSYNLPFFKKSIPMSTYLKINIGTDFHPRFHPNCLVLWPLDSLLCSRVPSSMYNYSVSSNPELSLKFFYKLLIPINAYILII